MRILITGGGGTLGRAVAPILAAAGHEPVSFDVARFDSPHEVVVGDVRRPSEVERAMVGVEVVVHAAAIHGIHLREHSARDFFELNLGGTFNTWQAAAVARVRGFVFCSTMGVYGASATPARDDEVVEIHEELPLLPTDVYGYTKVAGEEMCRYHVRHDGIPSVALRFGMFVSEPFYRYGVRLLYGGVDSDDVARAVLAAVDAVVAGGLSWDAFNVHSLVPFSAEDGRALRRDPLEAIERHYPRAAAALRERGIQRLKPILGFYPMGRAHERLGFRPKCNFREWLDELASAPPGAAGDGDPWW